MHDMPFCCFPILFSSAEILGVLHLKLDPGAALFADIGGVLFSNFLIVLMGFT
jgi:hypothetical protein